MAESATGARFTEDPGSAPAAPITVLMRAKWLILLLLTLYTFCAGTFYSLSRFGFFLSPSHAALLILALCLVVLYNFCYHYGYHLVGRFRFAHHLLVALDTVLVTVLIHFSGGVVSWLWPLYLVVMVEAVYLLERRREIAGTWLAAFFCHGSILLLEHQRVIRQVPMPFVGAGEQGDILYLLLIWCFAAILNAALAIIGHHLMRALRWETQLLRESEERLFSFLNRTSDLIHSNAPDGRFLYANDAWLSAMGYRRDELPALSLPDVVPQERLERFRHEFARILAGGESRCWEADYLTRGGSSLTLEGNLSCTYRGAEPVAVWGIGRDIGERKRKEEDLYRMAHHDPLTGLPNRLLFLDRLRQLRAVSQRTGQRMAVLFLDLDRFKSVNDTFGHAVGDRLLAVVAARLSGCVREMDTVARLGGDEFAVALGQLRDVAGAEVVARKVLNALALPCLVDAHAFKAGVSIGISVYPEDTDDLEELIRKADLAMYCAKEKGRGCYSSYSRELLGYTEAELALGLEQALARGELRLYYQPKLEMRTGRVTGVEALVRWEHPRLGLLVASQFLPVAEKIGLVEAIGRWVLEGACRQTRSWQDEGMAALPVAVNLSLAELKEDDLVQRVGAAVQGAGLEPHLLQLEIAERVLLRDPEHVKGVLSQLSALGVHLALDGMGGEGARHLPHLSVHSVKIDRGFTAAVEDERGARAASAIIDLVNSHKVKVVAEGVETQGQLLFLKGKRCDELQGYFFSRPLPPEKLADYVRGGAAKVGRQEENAGTG